MDDVRTIRARQSKLEHVGCLLWVLIIIAVKPLWAGPIELDPEGLDIPIESMDGGLWITVRINERVDARLLLDTGASTVILPQQLADALDIREEGKRRRLRTVHGEVIGRLVALDSIGLGDVLVRNVPAVILPDSGGQAIGLLGRSFLSRFIVRIDLDRSLLTLYPRAEVHGGYEWGG